MVLYYLCIIVYLYGDLAIYAAAIPKALASVVWYEELKCLVKSD